MTKRQDLYLQRRSRPEQSDQPQPVQAANISHQPRASPDSTSVASRIEFPTMTGAKERRSRREAQRSTFARFFGLFDFRLLQQYLPIPDSSATLIPALKALLNRIEISFDHCIENRRTTKSGERNWVSQFRS